MNTTLIPTNQKHVHDCNGEVDLKVHELTLLLSEIKNLYLQTDAAEEFCAIIVLIKIVQNKFLADEGDVYVHAYTNALKQMVLDLDTLIEHYQPLSK